MIRVVIVDFDDTLIRTKEMSFEKHAAVGEYFGYALDEATFFSNYGRPWPTLIEHIFPGLAFSDFYEYLVYLERDYPFQEIEGATNTLQHLREQGIIVGVLTSDFRDSFFRRAQRVGHMTYLDSNLIFCAGDTPYTKPDGRAFLPILDRLQSQGIGKEEMIFVGDLLTDYQAAKEAGVHFFAVTTGFQTANDFLRAGVSHSHILSSIAELPLRLAMYGEAQHG
ncbi:HAD-IA family hydrolase [Candidatus Woesearchaeota archaeon]|nr:HAD-IA family hydrolase [Candidatus Woesearchaeota archaeon]